MRPGPSSASTSSTIRCSSARWITWIRLVSSDGTTTPRPPARASGPPPRPRKATVAPSASARRARGGEQVRALAAGAVQHQQVARAAERLDLPGEDLLEAEVVARRGEHRGVGGERDRGERGAAVGVAHHVLGREVLRVGRAAAVAAEEQRPALRRIVARSAARPTRDLRAPGPALPSAQRGQRLEARADPPLRSLASLQQVAEPLQPAPAELERRHRRRAARRPGWRRD